MFPKEISIPVSLNDIMQTKTSLTKMVYFSFNPIITNQNIISQEVRRKTNRGPSAHRRRIKKFGRGGAIGVFFVGWEMTKIFHIFSAPYPQIIEMSKFYKELFSSSFHFSLLLFDFLVAGGGRGLFAVCTHSPPATGYGKSKWLCRISVN